MVNKKEEVESALVSVIVPVYNMEKFVKKCALSLIKQTYQRCEFIFVDDGSTDNSVGILQDIKDERVKIICQENKGVSVARNTGMGEASGEYIMFVDADDYVADDYVEYLYNLIKKYDADFAYSTKLFKSKKDKQTKKEVVRVVDGTESSGLLLSPDVTVGSYNKIYRKDIIEKNNLRFRPDLYYGEGLNFIIRMSLVSRKVVVGQRRILYYRKNNMSSATTAYDIDKCYNGLKSLNLIGGLINKENCYVRTMYNLHLANYYLGAITQMIQNGKVIECYGDYLAWKKTLRSMVVQIVRNRYVSKYRKCLIFGGAYFPYIVAKMDERRRKRIIKDSVE